MGKPISELPQVYQNGFGARWEFQRGFWEKDNVVVFAEIKVVELGGVAVRDAFSDAPATDGIQVTITDPEHAKLPETRPNSMD